MERATSLQIKGSWVTMKKIIKNQTEALSLVPGCTFRTSEGELHQVPSRQSLNRLGFMHAHWVEDYACMLPLADTEYGNFDKFFPLTVIWEPDWDITFNDFAVMEINEVDGFPVGWFARQQAVTDGVTAPLMEGAL
jgi:hypothetical protein